MSLSTARRRSLLRPAFRVAHRCSPIDVTAEVRSGDDDNKGRESAHTAVEMADLVRRIKEGV